jgi:iron(III) transport system ATP-binding protein
MPGVCVELKSASRARALREVSLGISAGDWIALLGPSGAGKTTLLRLVAGLDRPDSGAVLLDGRDAASIPPRERRVGMVFQDLALWPALTVESHLREVSPGEADALVARFGLRGLEERRPHQLSGGERQRLALARAAARDPRLLLLDEPFSNLDPLLRRSLAETLSGLHRERRPTTVYVSHAIDGLVARASRVVLLRDGRVEQSGTLSELRSAPRNEWVAAFVADEAEVER